MLIFIKGKQGKNIMLIEGKNSVIEALNVKKKISKIYLQELNSTKDILQKAKQQGVKVEIVQKQVLDKMSKTPNHQGVIAEVEDYKYYAIDDLIKDDGLIVLLDSIEDPHNLGSIIRTCECAGVDGVVIPKHRSAQVNETVVKTSAGAVNHIKIAKVNSINDAIEYLKKQGYFVFATAMDGELASKTNLKGKIGLVIGNEGSGVHRLTRQLCDGTLRIEMYGKLNSLNASVACGIILFQTLEQRK